MSYSTEGSGVGFLGEPPVVCSQQQGSDGSNNDARDKMNEMVKAASQHGARVTFRFQLCERTAVVWQAVLYKQCVYLKPGDALPDGSKEAFVALLEYAEEHLGCKQIFVCFNKDIMNKAGLIRTFMFLGFSVVAPGHPKAPHGNYFSLVYTIEDEEDEDDELTYP